MFYQSAYKVVEGKPLKLIFLANINTQTMTLLPLEHHNTGEQSMDMTITVEPINTSSIKLVYQVRLFSEDHIKEINNEIITTFNTWIHLTGSCEAPASKNKFSTQKNQNTDIYVKVEQ